jgi:lysine 6-dehydrogenase
MGKKVLLAGLGMQGQAVLYDLARRAEISGITVVDTRPDLHAWLERYPAEKVHGHKLDAADETALAPLMRDADIVVEALPAAYALPLGKLAAHCGVSLVSSMYYLNPGERDEGKIRSVREEIRQIDRKAKDEGIVILTEFGLDPGLDLILGAAAVGELDRVREFAMYGAGIPAPNARDNPLQYKFSWSSLGVMKAYRRPGKIISGGRVLSIDADRIFEPQNTHILTLEEAGSRLECFVNGDCVHYAELFGIRDSVREMGRYTCRLPGHCAFWNTMAKCGFLDESPIRIGDASVAPIQFTASLLDSQPQFHYSGDEQDIALIRVDAHGTHRGVETRIVYQLADRKDPATGFTAMQRTVGFTLSLGAQLILEGGIGKIGLLTPLDLEYEAVFPRLEKHNLRVDRREFSGP